LKICMDRVRRNLDALSEIGRKPSGGIDRALGSEEDEKARRWLIHYWTCMGLAVRVDAIGNLWATYRGTEDHPPIAVGSHHDTVPDGGMYDGALGVLLATELVETLMQSGIRLRHDIAIVSFSGEEPNPYQVSTLGSKVASGRLVRQDLEAMKSAADGTPLGAYISRIGGDIGKADEARLHPGDVGAFLECHIEQGRCLFDTGLPLASVSSITGIYREFITVQGEPNHAGTTKMKDRKDALPAAAELVLAFEGLVAGTGREEVVGTVGSLNVFPNSVNIIPGVVELALEVRTMDPVAREEIIRGLGPVCKDIEHRRGVRILRRVGLDQAAIDLDKDIIDAVECAIAETVDEGPRLMSMAGHDAANMQRVTKSGMLFVQSVNGASHCPNEFTGDTEIEKAGDALLKAVMILDGRLDSEKAV
jgi:N-carbamoyl-L-amino-acid hydrolase